MKRNIFLDSDSNVSIYPNENFNDKQHSKNYSQNKNSQKLQILPNQLHSNNEILHSKQKDTMSRDSSKKLSSLLAGKKSRQRKKIYLQELQTNVNNLEKQIIKYEEQIKKTQDILNQTLNSTKNNQNQMTYAQLQLCLQAQYPNQDKINLLLDLVKFRIGASSRQRKAKIQYYFKQIINLMFPALHRYLMYCSEKCLDLFEETNIQSFFAQSQNIKDQSILPWTKDFLETVNMTQSQKNQIFQINNILKDKKYNVKRIIRQLVQLKDKFKKQGQTFENYVDKFRNIMKPFQCASWVLFIEKYKYKKQVNFENQMQLLNQCVQFEPTKKIKID